MSDQLPTEGEPRLFCDCGCGTNLFDEPRMAMVSYHLRREGYPQQVLAVRVSRKGHDDNPETFPTWDELGSWLEDPDRYLSFMVDGNVNAAATPSVAADLATVAEACRRVVRSAEWRARVEMGDDRRFKLLEA